MSENNINCYEFDEYRLDVTNFQLLENGEPISLTQKSFELLHFLVENRGRIIKKEELLDSLWEGNYVEEANLTQHIYMLRKALKQQDRKKVFIETIPKNGYRFLADVREIYFEKNQSNGHISIEPDSSQYPAHNFQGGFLDGNIHTTNDYQHSGLLEKKQFPNQLPISKKSFVIILLWMD